MKYVLLTQGKKAIVDDEDYKYINQWNWHYKKQRFPYKSGYAARAIYPNGKQKYIRMHRIIIKTDKLVDHINGNGLDNRKNNLRICSLSQNSQNAKKRKDNSSGYKGVSYFKSLKKWIARIQYNKKRILLGYFNTSLEAAKAYNKAAKKHHNQFAKLNKVS